MDFAVDGIEVPAGTPLEVLSDHEWRDSVGRDAGVFVSARAGRLAGLEVYTLHPDAAIDRLPSLHDIQTFDGSAT